MGAISQRALHRIRLRLKDRVLVGASLFPLFDDAGRVSSILLVTAGSPSIHLIEWQPGLFKVHWFKGRLLDREASSLVNIGSEEAERVAHLWHFDPWWVLGEPNFAGHPAVPPLKGTNIPGYDTSVEGMGFSKDLGQVSWIGMDIPSGTEKKPFTADSLLATRRIRKAQTQDDPSSPSGAETPEWELRPFWKPES